MHPSSSAHHAATTQATTAHTRSNVQPLMREAAHACADSAQHAGECRAQRAGECGAQRAHRAGATGEQQQRAGVAEGASEEEN